MERLFHIANSYHRITHCCPWRVIFKNPITCIYILSCLTFPASFFLTIIFSTKPFVYIPLFLLMIISEGFLLLGPDQIRKSRNNYITEKFKHRFKRNFHSIDDVKKLVIDRHFKKAERNYGHLIDYIKKSIEIYKEKQSAIDIFDYAFRFFKNPLTFNIKTIAVLSPLAISIASIHFGIDEKNFIQLIKNLSENTIALIFIALLFSYFIFTVATFIIHSSPLFFDRAFSALRKHRKYHNIYTLKSLQHDLLLYSRIPEPKANKD